MPGILPIMPALCPMLLVAYYASNYAGIIGRCLTVAQYTAAVQMMFYWTQL